MTTSPSHGETDAAHTPGPWRITRKYEIGPQSTENDQSYGMVIPIADVFGDNRDADARLIAAAPDLLAALRFILAFYEPGQRHLDTNAWKNAEAAARSAVADAEGHNDHSERPLTGEK